MQLTMSGDYALRAMMALASDGDTQLLHIGDISRNWKIPEKFLRKIVPRLVRAGFVETARGIGGGIRLLVPAKSITALDILESVEGQLYLDRCVINGDRCDRISFCAMHTLWQEARESLRAVLSSRTLSDLVAVEQKRVQVDP